MAFSHGWVIHLAIYSIHQKMKKLKPKKKHPNKNIRNTKGLRCGHDITLTDIFSYIILKRAEIDKIQRNNKTPEKNTQQQQQQQHHHHPKKSNMRKERRADKKKKRKKETVQSSSLLAQRVPCPNSSSRWESPFFFFFFLALIACLHPPPPPESGSLPRLEASGVCQVYICGWCKGNNGVPPSAFQKIQIFSYILA